MGSVYSHDWVKHVADLEAGGQTVGRRVPAVQRKRCRTRRETFNLPILRHALIHTNPHNSCLLAGPGGHRRREGAVQLPFPCQTLEGTGELLSLPILGWIHLQTRKSAPPICCSSVRTRDSWVDRKRSARSHTRLILSLPEGSMVRFRSRDTDPPEEPYSPVLGPDQRVSNVGDGQVGGQVLVLLAGLTVAPQHIYKKQQHRANIRGEGKKIITDCI